MSRTLSPMQARAIFLDRRCGREIAKDYPVHQVTISCIKQLKTWKHING